MGQMKQRWWSPPRQATALSPGEVVQLVMITPPDYAEFGEFTVTLPIADDDRISALSNGDDALRVTTSSSRVFFVRRGMSQHCWYVKEELR